jgi:hypothetical protein
MDPQKGYQCWQTKTTDLRRELADLIYTAVERRDALYIMAALSMGHLPNSQFYL